MGLRYDPSVRDLVRTLAPGPRKAVRQALALIEEDARHPDLDWKVLHKDASTLFLRARVLRDYRIVYSPRPGHTYVWRVMHRREGYGWLERLDP